MAFDVFISYAAGDKLVADAACARLEATGLRCWIAPRDILAGREWASSIVEAINLVRAFVLVFSSNSNNSHHVRREVELAMQASVVVVPFRVEPVEPVGGLLYYIGDAHWLDALTPPLEAHLEKLSETLAALLAEPRSPEQSTERVPTVAEVAPPVPPPRPTPSPAPPSPSPGTRRSRRRTVGTIIAVALACVAGVGGLVIANANGQQSSVACEHGVRWQQHTAPYNDGTVVESDGKVGVVYGGALIGVRSPEELAASGLDAAPRVTVSRSDFAGLNTAPHDGLVLRERQSPGSLGRLFYATGGAVFQVQDPAALRKLGVDPDHPTTIPAYGLDGAKRQPPSGTLLRVDGTRTVWVIEGGARHVAPSICSGADVNVLPDDARVLDAIPASDARGS